MFKFLLDGVPEDPLAALAPLPPPESGTEIELDLADAVEVEEEVFEFVVVGVEGIDDSPSIFKLCILSITDELLSLTGLVDTDDVFAELVSSMLIWTLRR